MKKLILIILCVWLAAALYSQPRHIHHDDSFTRNNLHTHYSAHYESQLFGIAWTHVINSYLVSTNFSDNISSVTSYNPSTKDPEELLGVYFEKINQLNSTFEQQKDAKNAVIDQGIRDLGELGAQIARDNNISTKNPILDFIIKEGAITVAQETAKKKAAENLEQQRVAYLNDLNSKLSTDMAAIRDEMVADNTDLKNQYLKAMAYEADPDKETYYSGCYIYYDCFLNQIKTQYNYQSNSWYRPNCEVPREVNSGSSPQMDDVDVAYRKYELYNKYKDDIFLTSTNVYLEAGLSANKQNAKAYSLKAQIESDIIDKMFFASLAVSFAPQNNEYNKQLEEITRSFDEDFYSAIRNGDEKFISRSIEKGLQLGRSYNDKTGIEAAIDFDKVAIFEMLINSVPEEKNSLSVNGMGLLFHACAVDALEVVKSLINMGMNPEIIDKKNSGLTALNIAVESNSKNVLSFIAANYNIKPALLYAKRSGQNDLAEISHSIYEVVPGKLSEIKTVYAKFDPGSTDDIRITVADNDHANDNGRSSNITAETGPKSTPTSVELPHNITEVSNTGNETNTETDNEAKSMESFKSDFGTFLDPRDGRQYSWVKLNGQIWMSENLAYLPSGENVAWIYNVQRSDLNTLSNSANLKAYGVLYNYNTAIKSCPDGWKIPTDLEWSKLENFLDNTVIDFNQIAYRGTTIGSRLIMAKPGSIKAVFGGKMTSNGKFIGIGDIGTYWTSTRTADSKVWNRQIQKNLPQIIRAKSNENEGYSVRCVKY